MGARVRWPRDHRDAASWVRERLPDGAAAALRPIGRGEDSLAFRATWPDARPATVVRVARGEEAAAGLQREACAMARIADRLPVAVPRPTFARVDAGRAFSVHAPVEGQVLTRARWQRLRAAARERAASDLAAFFAALHELPVAEVRACGLPVLECTAYAAALRASAARHLHPLLAPAVRDRLDAALDAWACGADVPPVVLHRDLSPEHVLHDPADGRITGILDFGDLAIGDPARDFIFVREDHDDALLAMVLRRYPHERPAAVVPRVLRWGVLEAVAWTLGRHAARRPAAVEEGLAAITRALDDALAGSAGGA